VVTLVVLGDIHPGWRPCRFERELMGCRVVFEFPVCKLLDLLPKGGQEGSQAGERVSNLAVLAALAQIAALRTNRNPRHRLKERLLIFRQVLQDQAWKKKEIVDAFRLVSWMMKLPKPESLQFREIVSDWPEMKATLPLTDIEEIWLEEGIEKGRQEGHQEGIECGEWIGKVNLLETLLRQEPTSLAILKKETLRQLRARFHKLDKEYHKKHRD
jgi:hypothetical protein